MDPFLINLVPLAKSYEHRKKKRHTGEEGGVEKKK